MYGKSAMEIAAKELEELIKAAESPMSAIEELAGVGRTTETVKGNADALAAHKADNMAHVKVFNITSFTQSGAVYPSGISISDVTGSMGFPVAGLAITTKFNDNRMTQIIYENGNNNNPKQYKRDYHSIGGWTQLRDITVDVEEGIFTPTLTGVTTAGNHTYSVRVGYYLRIGKLVSVIGRVQLSAKDASMSGAARIMGLPFVAKNNDNGLVSVNVGHYNQFTGLSGGGVSGYILPNSSVFDLVSRGPNASMGVNSSNITDTTSLVFSAVYHI